MAELDTSRDLTFVHGTSTAADGTPGLGIMIPITGTTRQWDGALRQLAFDKHLDVTVQKGDHLLLRLSPGASREEVLRTLDLVQDLVDQANQLERDRLDRLADTLSPLQEAARDWWQRR